MAEHISLGNLEKISEEEQKKLLNEAMDEEKQRDFYKRLRSKVNNYTKKHPNSKFISYLVAAPDFFHLLCKLIIDNRVPLKNKLYIAATILYFTSPLDLISDLIPGIGITDDVIIAVSVIKSLLDSVDDEVIKELWAGDGDVIDQLQELLSLADSVVGKGLIGKIKAFLSKDKT